MSALFAATYPQRTRALVLYGSYAKRMRGDDYPWAPTWEERVRYADELEQTWGENVDISTMIPGADAATTAWFQRRGRASLSPAAARDLILMNSKVDVRDVLPTIQCPTLVLHRTGDRDSHIDEGRYIAGRIPGARFVELPGGVHVPWVAMDDILAEVEEFLTGVRPAPRAGGSWRRSSSPTWSARPTARASSATPRGPRSSTATTLIVRRRACALRRVEIDTAGDGFLSLFDGPARAIRAGSRSASRCGRSTWTSASACTRARSSTRTTARAGSPFIVAARVVAEAGAGEVLVTQTTHDLVEGSGLGFEDRGLHELKGIETPGGSTPRARRWA